MKAKNLLIAISIAGIINLPSMAEITPAEARSEQYILNHGHSEETARLLNLQHKQITGKQVEPADSQMSWPVRWYRKIFGYFDPAIDDGSFGHTKLHTNPHPEDL